MNYKVYHPKNKLITSLKEHYIYKATLLLIAFFALTTTAFAQTTETYTTSGSWTVPTAVTSVTVHIWGAGGGGGGSNANNSGGSGGGSGAYVTQVIPVTAGDIIPYTIGTGGAGGAAGTIGTGTGGTGGTGGNSTITIGSFTLTANGGTGGTTKPHF